MASDEGEAVAIAAGVYLATNKRALVVISADGFCNALNPLTSYVMPEKIEMDFIISVGRQEPPHEVMSNCLEQIINLLNYDKQRISFTFLRKE